MYSPFIGNLRTVTATNGWFAFFIFCFSHRHHHDIQVYVSYMISVGMYFFISMKIGLWSGSGNFHRRSLNFFLNFIEEKLWDIFCIEKEVFLKDHYSPSLSEGPYLPIFNSSYFRESNKNDYGTIS